MKRKSVGTQDILSTLTRGLLVLLVLAVFVPSVSANVQRNEILRWQKHLNAMDSVYTALTNVTVTGPQGETGPAGPISGIAVINDTFDILFADSVSKDRRISTNDSDIQELLDSNAIVNWDTPTILGDTYINLQSQIDDISSTVGTTFTHDNAYILLDTTTMTLTVADTFVGGCTLAYTFGIKSDAQIFFRLSILSNAANTVIKIRLRIDTGSGHEIISADTSTFKSADDASSHTNFVVLKGVASGGGSLTILVDQTAGATGADIKNCRIHIRALSGRLE